MPTLVNGCGTRYVGTRNLSVRHGVCTQCQRSTQLSSYDTTLYFVVFFIPVIPLSKKRVTDACSSCRRHYVADAATHHLLVQSAVSQAKDHFRQTPSVETAIDAHAELIGCRLFDEAADFRQEALTAFPNSAHLLAVFGRHLFDFSQLLGANECLDQALQLQPDLPLAREGKAWILLNQGELSKALELADYLLQPGAGQVYSLVLLETLGNRFFARKQYQEALSLFQVLVRELPGLDQHYQIRATIHKCEKKLGVKQTSLPKSDASWLGVFDRRDRHYSPKTRKFAWITTILMAVVIGLCSYFWLSTWGGTVYLLNGLGKPLRVQIDNGPPMDVVDRTKITLVQGRHHVTVSGVIQASYDVNIATTFLDRITKRPVWVINLGGSALLVSSRVHYAKQNPPPPDNVFYGGQDVLTFDHVDYPFENLPDSLKMGDSHEIIKVGLQVVPGNVAACVSAIGDDALALTFCESHLTVHPDDDALLSAYQTRARSNPERAEAYLKKKLYVQPLNVNWHRTYGEVLGLTGSLDSAIQYYDQCLEEDPLNGQLIYLRGRIEANPQAQKTFAERSKLLAPDFPYGHWLLANIASKRGDWAESLQCLKDAEAAGMSPAYVEGLRACGLTALGQESEILEDYRTQLSNPTESFTAMARIIAIQAARGSWQPLREEFWRWSQQYVRTSDSRYASQSVDALRLYMLYQIQDFDEMERSLNSVPESLSQSQFDLHIMGRCHPTGLDDVTLQSLSFDSWKALGISVAFGTEHNFAKAEVYRKKAVERFQQGSVSDRLAAKWLQADTPPPVEDVLQFGEEREQALLLSCALAQRFPRFQQELQPWIAKVNVLHTTPYWLVKKVFP